MCSAFAEYPICWQGYRICEAGKIPWSDHRSTDELYSTPEGNTREEEDDLTVMKRVVRVNDGMSRTAVRIIHKDVITSCAAVWSDVLNTVLGQCSYRLLPGE